MPWGMSGFGSYREPAPRRLTLEELLAEEFTPRPRPTPITSLRDLQGDDRRAAQMDSLWGGLASMGALLSGDQRRAAAGLGDIQASQDRALGAANARQEAEYEADMERQAHDLARQKREQEAKALLGMYEEVSAGESPEFTRKAEQAARAGSMAELEKLRESKPQRAAAKAKGYDPDAWDTTKRLQDELEAELKRAAAQKDWEEGEKARLEEKNRIEREDKLATEEEMRRRKLRTYKPPEYEPLSRIAARTELVESIRDKHETTRAGGVAGKIGKVGETWGWLSPPDKAHPNGSFAPLDGQPKNVGEYTYFTVDGQRYVQDKNRPNLGAFPVALHEEGQLPPPDQKPAGIGATPKVSADDKAELVAEIAARYPNLTSAERAAKLKLALRKLAETP